MPSPEELGLKPEDLTRHDRQMTGVEINTDGTAETVERKSVIERGREYLATQMDRLNDQLGGMENAQKWANQLVGHLVRVVGAVNNEMHKYGHILADPPTNPAAAMEDIMSVVLTQTPKIIEAIRARSEAKKGTTQVV